VAKLYFTYSAMNAGKSAILLQAAHNYQERGMSVMLWTSHHHGSGPHADLGKIVSRIGLEAPARLYRPGQDLFAAVKAEAGETPVHAVLLDEAQFLTRDQVRQLARVCDDLEIPVLCYGLRTDFMGELFDGAAELLAMADDLREVRTLCHCGRKATMNLRQSASGEAVRGGDQVAVDKDVYVSLCRRHWREAMADKTPDFLDEPDRDAEGLKGAEPRVSPASPQPLKG
jgi:thymidine kinase